MKTARVSELRDAFDQDFAAAPRPAEPSHRDFLCIRVGGEPSAIPLGDIASLHADLRVVALPSRAPELLGVAAIRAALVPIYDLGFAFGVSRADVPRWIVVVRGGAAGFAFEGYDGHARIPDRAIAAASQRRHMTGQFSAGGQPRSIIDLGTVLAAIENRRHAGGTAKEP
jgi:purine-binding chemotaxis protein CheW